ncbi:MAG: tRNA (adenosine(37)-N6)-threonylcarbamoyltransferase complex dimerization subunit type 1 TsaB [Pyrinomonadaceae bacterium]
MNIESHGQIILAIESAVSGGSISLLCDGHEVANWIGSSDISKAEDLLSNIDTLFTQNGISINDVDLIGVSAGPGSFTGIRIGLATALGLKNGLGIGMSSESALKAMVFVQLPSSNTIVAAVPVGRNAVCQQRFQRSQKEIVAMDEPHTLTEDEFLSFVHTEENAAFLLHEDLYKKIIPSEAVINFGPNIAYAVGLVCRENDFNVTEPLFISKSF